MKNVIVAICLVSPCTAVLAAVDDSAASLMGCYEAEVFDAEADRLRIELGGGTVASFEFPPDGGPATAVVILGKRFERFEP